MDVHTILESVRTLSARFATERGERQRRRTLDRADFDALRDAGFLLTGVPAGEGGVWEDLRRSARPICEMLRLLAHGDASVALVCSMHPSVLSFWLASPTAPAPFASAPGPNSAAASSTACAMGRGGAPSRRSPAAVGISP